MKRIKILLAIFLGFSFQVSAQVEVANLGNGFKSLIAFGYYPISEDHVIPYEKLEAMVEASQDVLKTNFRYNLMTYCQSIKTPNGRVFATWSKNVPTRIHGTFKQGKNTYLFGSQYVGPKWTGIVYEWKRGRIIQYADVQGIPKGMGINSVMKIKKKKIILIIDQYDFNSDLGFSNKKVIALKNKKGEWVLK